MDTVNEFKKLLELDIDQLRINLNEAKSLEAANSEADKLSKLIAGEKIAVVDQHSANQRNDKASGEDCANQDIINPGIDGNNVKTFEELINKQLQCRVQQHSQPDLQQHQSKNRCTEKRPFLRKGEGLRRFSPGNASKIESTVTPPQKCLSQAQNVDKLLHQKRQVVDNKLIAKEPMPRAPVDKCGPKKRLDFARKVLPISTKSTTQAPNGLNIIKNSKCSEPRDNQLENVGKNSSVLPANVTIDTRVDYANHKVDNEISNRHFVANNVFAAKSKPDEKNNLRPIVTSHQAKGHQYNYVEPKNGLYTLQLLKQIGELEKHLLDLMTLKGHLTQEKSNSWVDQSDGLISSIDDIRKEISTLNSKVSSLSKTKPDVNLEEKEEEKSGADECDSNDVDINSRHFAVPKHVVSTLSNGDKITVGADQSITYEHLNGTSQTLYKDGLKVIRFPNGQIEKIFPDGTKQIIYSNGQQRVLKSDNSEEILLTDGTVYSICADGERIEYQNGDVEWKTNDYTRRHFSNGNIKTVYANGCQETIFSNGRIRMKDKFGNVLFDRMP